MYVKPVNRAEMRGVNFYLPVDLYIRLKARCAAERTSLRAACTAAIVAFLNGRV